MKNKNAVLFKIWIATALVAVAVVLAFLIKSDSEERQRQAELYALLNSNGNSPYYPSGKPQTGGNNASSANKGENTPENSDVGGAGDNNDVSTPEVTDEPEPTPTDIPEPTNGPERGDININGIDPTKPIVALSFDDGPSVNTPKILATLKKYNAHATFFMVGENITKYPDYIREMKAAGCEPANHTIDHKDLKTLSKSEITHEVEDNQASINAVLGSNDALLLRPPYGNYNDTVKEVVQHPMILWTVDTLDWKSRNAQSVFEEVKKSTKDGYIILMHDIYSSTAEAVELVVPWLVEQGYQICSVSEMYKVRGETLKDGHTYRYTYTVQEYLDRQQTADTN